MTCGCPDGRTFTNEERHARWHDLIEPLITASASELEAAFGHPSRHARTYIDAQFDRARQKAFR